jgi:hypothetical protein
MKHANENANGSIASSPFDFDSPYCENLVFDGPGDTTARPCSPEDKRRLMAERERLAKLGFNFDGTPIKPAGENGAG